MMRRLRFKKAWLCITLALAMACWSQPAAAYVLEVSAWIDGYSKLLIQGSTVQWHNIDYTVPGLEPETQLLHNDPTKLTTADMTYDWYPVWPGGTTGNQWSDQFTDLNKPLSTTVDQTVGLTVLMFRPSQYVPVEISQQPSASNGYTLIVAFNDYPNGAAWYKVQLDYTPVPLPSTVLLLGSGLLGLGCYMRRKKS